MPVYMTLRGRIPHMRGLEPIGFVLVVFVCGSFPHPRPAVSVLSFDGALSHGGLRWSRRRLGIGGYRGICRYFLVVGGESVSIWRCFLYFPLVLARELCRVIHEVEESFYRGGVVLGVCIRGHAAHFIYKLYISEERVAAWSSGEGGFP